MPKPTTYGRTIPPMVAACALVPVSNRDAGPADKVMPFPRLRTITFHRVDLTGRRRLEIDYIRIFRE